MRCKWDHLFFFFSSRFLFWRGKNCIRFMIFNTIFGEITRHDLTKWRLSIISCQFADSNSLPAVAYIFHCSSLFYFFFFYMDNGFKIGAETRIHNNVTIVNEKSSWIPQFMDYLFVEIIFMKKFYCKNYTHHDVILLLSSILWHDYILIRIFMQQLYEIKW